MHEGGGAHQHFLIADDAGQAALVGPQAGYFTVKGTLSAQQVMERTGQAAAEGPQQGGGVGHCFFGRVTAEHPNLSHLNGAGGKQVKVGHQNACLTAAGYTGPTGDGGTQLVQAGGQLSIGPGIGQQR